MTTRRAGSSDVALTPRRRSTRDRSSGGSRSAASSAPSKNDESATRSYAGRGFRGKHGHQEAARRRRAPSAPRRTGARPCRGRQRRREQHQIARSSQRWLLLLVRIGLRQPGRDGVQVVTAGAAPGGRAGRRRQRRPAARAPVPGIPQLPLGDHVAAAHHRVVGQRRRAGTAAGFRRQRPAEQQREPVASARPRPCRRAGRSPAAASGRPIRIAPTTRSSRQHELGVPFPRRVLEAQHLKVTVGPGSVSAPPTAVSSIPAAFSRVTAPLPRYRALGEVPVSRLASTAACSQPGCTSPPAAPGWPAQSPIA